MATNKPAGPSQPRSATHVIADGRYYWPRGQFGAITLVVTAGRLYAVPMIVGRRTLFTAIVAQITTGGAGNFNMGVYDHDEGNGYPGNLIAAAAEQSSAGIAILEPSFPVWLADMVWLAITFSGTPTVRAFSSTTVVDAAPLGTTSNDPQVAADLMVGLFAAFSYAALPAIFPSSPTYIQGLSMPRIGLKT